MVRLSTITTKQGDGGMTMLGDGSFVSKADRRIEAYGTVDEAGAFIGLALGSIDDTGITKLLQTVQQHLFNLGSVLCRPHREDSPPRHPITARNIDFLEQNIADYNAPLPELESFILCGGSEASSRLHAARVVTRRAERRVIALSADATVPPEIVIYLNRLSDLLFILARRMNHNGKEDILWQPEALDD